MGLWDQNRGEEGTQTLDALTLNLDPAEAMTVTLVMTIMVAIH